jgi:hypothetical protein
MFASTYLLRGISCVYGGSVCKQLRSTAKYDAAPTSGDNLCRDGRPTCPVWSGRPARFGVPGRQPAENVWKDWLDYGGSDQLCMSINDDVRIFAYFFQVCRRIGDIPDL